MGIQRPSKSESIEMANPHGAVESAWNVILEGYFQSGNGDEAVKLVTQMRVTCPKPNVVLWNNLIVVCARASHLFII